VICLGKMALKVNLAILSGLGLRRISKLPLGILLLHYHTTTLQLSYVMFFLLFF